MMQREYRHVVTSSAKLDYSEKVLRAVCLDAYFDCVFGRDKVSEGIWGKKYSPVAELYNLNDADACSQMLVIANMPSDEPVDLGIVFLHDERDIEGSALVYETIAEALWERGEGHFVRGFESFFETGKKVSCLEKDFDFSLVSTKIDGAASIDMGYKISPCTEGLRIPTILNIRPV
jgi:hypothetical protein